MDGSGLIRLEHLLSKPDGTGDIYQDDEHASHQKSKWLKYRQTSKPPLVAIILMYRLGEPPKTNDEKEFMNPEDMLVISFS